MKFARAFLFAFAFTWLIGAQWGSAHANLESSSPATDSLLATPPTEIVLTFSEQIDLSGVTVTAIGEDGTAIKLDPPRLDPGNNRRVRVSSDDFSIGAYTITWSNQSVTDGHTLSGSFAFRVGGSSTALAAATVEGDRPPAWGVLLRWLTFLGAAPAIGFLVAAPTRRRRHIATGGLAIALFASLLEPILLWQFPPAGSIAASLNDTIRAQPNGWWVRIAGLGLALVVCLTPRFGEFWRQVIGAVALIGMAGLALTSHAAGRAHYAWAATGVSFLHNAAAAIWIGALALIVIAPLEHRWAELRQFSRHALPLAIIAVAAGVINAGLIFPTLGTLTSTDYERVLIGKVIMVVAILALAGYHHLTLRKALSDLPHLMGNSIRVELGLIAAAVAFASTLALLAPPQISHGELSRVELAMPTGSGLTNDQVFVRLTIDPARTGENVLTAYATQGPPLTVETDANGASRAVNHPPITDVQLIKVTLTSLDLRVSPRDVELQSLGDGRFQGKGVNFSAKGWWRALVTIRRANVADDLRAEFFLRTPDPNISGFKQAAGGGSDPAAETLFSRARDQLAQQPWVVFRQNLSGGNGGVELATQTWSNGGLKIATPNVTLIRIGGQRYVKDQSGVWRQTDDSDPQGPAAWMRELDGATDIALGKKEMIKGRTAQAVHFYVPGTVLAPAFYTWWIDVDSGQVVQEAMVSRSHYMIQRYEWFAAPPRIVAPI